MSMEKKTVVMDFSGVYSRQRFCRGEEFSLVDVRGFPGTNCYCDGEACASLREKLGKYPAEGIHFLDSGNYHYMSRIWMEKIREPFRLLVFDNHTDMQPPAFGGILSCGGWIAAGLEELPKLREVVLVGPGEEEFAEDFAALSVTDRSVLLYGRSRLRESPRQELFSFLRELDAALPLYVSIDKDVLCPEDACTAWSQGEMRLAELLACLEVLREGIRSRGLKVIGADICGECPCDATVGEEEMLRNDRANAALFQELKQWDFFCGGRKSGI